MADGALADGKSYQAAVDRCLNQFANTNESATVTLECSAGGGKLEDCKVLDNSGPKGFAQAAVCVAKELPIGGKTGLIKVPVRFAGANG
jgi:hypothetical protein